MNNTHLADFAGSPLPSPSLAPLGLSWAILCPPAAPQGGKLPAVLAFRRTAGTFPSTCQYTHLMPRKEKNMVYNLRVKTYADGTKAYMFFEQARKRDYEITEPPERDGSTVEQKKVENSKRAVQRVYDLARSNKFEWFVTLTLSPEVVNRYDYEACADCIKKFTKWLGKRNGSWIMVAENHEDGAYHFHGLVNGDFDPIPAVNPHTGKLMTDSGGRQVYNIGVYPFGFSNATRIEDAGKSSNYVAKYINKCHGVPKGKKRYWASRNLQEPEIEYTDMTVTEFGEIFNDASWSKVIESDYGKFLMCEHHPKESE